MDALTSPAELGELALQLGREAGAMLLAGSGDVRAVATKTSQHDLVTQMDQDSEVLIRSRITELRPQDVVMGEEQGTIGTLTGADAVRWIVDPVDGTVNYFYGIPSWAVSIAAERDGIVVAGAVVAPALGEEYLGVRGAGSWSIVSGDRVRLAVGSVSDLHDAVVSTGFGYVPERRQYQGQVVARMLPRVRDIRRVGSASVDLCWVAGARMDAHFERGLKPWDRAAGCLIAREAGAVVGGLAGAPESEDMTVVAAPALFPQLVDLLTELNATGGP